MNGPFFKWNQNCSPLSLVRLKGDGMTLVVSSRILAELDGYSTHMLMLRAGRIVERPPLLGEPRKGTGRVMRRYGDFQGWG